MARINLLPWRAERRRQRKQQFTMMLGVAALAGLLLSGLIWIYYNGQISGQQDRNTYLQGQISELDRQIAEIKELDEKKADLLRRKQAIEELQSNRFQMVHLFDSVVRTLPDGIVLTQLKQEGDMLTIDGRSESNARVAMYMRNIEGSGWMISPDINVIENAPSTAPAPTPGSSVMNTPASVLPYQFTMKVKLSNPNAAKDPNATPGTITTTAAPANAPLQPASPQGTTAPMPTPAPANGQPAAAPAAPAPVAPAAQGQQPAAAPQTQAQAPASAGQAEGR
ncbi:PilN domain-containing protein [Solilutibacter silvestris]|uniref:Fimbrial assembly protein PilN n=1 Tax=Solilutibacter silvestris TaxID=1645665 RepID=A0A2K1PX33_9GAMM|nr:PilN domain-containing protein [Lysobacter silvestris]PNS07348.1 Fimbrial assembly protein PilN [Lysobacter silvestris]